MSDTDKQAQGGELKNSRPHPIRRLYNWVLHWAETPYGVWALFALAFAESSFFPIPPDVLLIALAFSIPAKSFRYALICTIGSVLGGLFGYLIGFGLWEAVDTLFIPLLFSQHAFDRVVGYYDKYDFWIVFIAAFTPIPYKVITITAGVCKISLPMFVLASAIGRAARFYIVALLIHHFGKSIRGFIEKYFNLMTVLFTVFLVGGFVILTYWEKIKALLG